jgi:hypothetical protein
MLEAKKELVETKVSDPQRPHISSNGRDPQRIDFSQMVTLAAHTQHQCDIKAFTEIALAGH